MKIFKKLTLLYGILLFTAIACSGRDGADRSIASPATEEMAMEDAEMIYEETGQAETRQQKRIKESYLRFETQDPDKTYTGITRYVKENNGYIQSDTQGKGYNELSRELVIRIPAENFQKTIDAISKDVSFFDVKRISSTDVTEEFIDLEARLKAKRSLETRYLELLAKAQNVKDILEIEKELAAIREEIEAREGRLQFLENRVAYSTLTVSFYKRTAETGITTSYGAKIRNALQGGINTLSYFFLGLLHLWPFLLLFLIILFIIRIKYLKKDRR